MDNEKYIKKWLDDSLSEEDHLVFDKTQDYQSLQKLDKALYLLKAPEYDVESELVRLQEHKNKKTTSMHISWIQPVLKIAAVITLVLLGYYLFFNQAFISIETGIAEKEEHQLPDQSIVTLNARSNLSYNENKWNEQRAVELYGEAYFKVAKGARFSVKTAYGLVTVLGTQFNVKGRDDFFEVVCYEGMVAVESNDELVKLKPNHIFRIIGSEVFLDSTNVNKIPSWLNNESSFISVPYKQVIGEFERQYNVSITTKNVDLDQLFTGRFTHNDLGLAIKSISLPLNLNYEQEEDQHIILSKGTQ